MAHGRDFFRPADLVVRRKHIFAANLGPEYGRSTSIRCVDCLVQRHDMLATRSIAIALWQHIQAHFEQVTRRNWVFRQRTSVRKRSVAVYLTQ